MITFQNKGGIDPRLVTTMGVNVKETDNPIGFFGTGLKYAIAILLREEQEITIWSGLTKMTFQTEKDTIRGKEFEFILMTCSNAMTSTSQRLAFTTEYGKKWSLWQAYRELYCNTKDEGGEICDFERSPMEGHTTITVSGEAFLSTHLKRHEFILTSRALSTNASCDIHPANNAAAVFYQGIKVHSPVRTQIFTYDLRSHQELTEDRSLSMDATATAAIAKASLECTDPGICRDIIMAPEGSFEWCLDYNWFFIEPGPVFVEVMDSCIASHRMKVVPSIRSLHERLNPKDSRPQSSEPTPIEAKVIAKTLVFLEKIGHKVQYPIFITDGLGSGVMAMTYLKGEPEIFISKLAFQMGTKQVAGAIFEEQVHLSTQFLDGSRPMQNWLVDKIMSLGEELLGEPL